MNTILITGAGTGLGKELALAYAKKGNTIILTGRKLLPLKEVQLLIEEMGGHAEVYTIDITNVNELEHSVHKILKHHNVNFLINNAGIGSFGPFTALSLDEIETMINTNVKGTIYMTKIVLPHLLKHRNGKVFNIISTAGQKGKVNESVYVASKFAIRGFTESLQKEYEGKLNIKAVYMGGMDTPFWEKSDHIKDKSRLRPPKEIAKKIIKEDENGTDDIFV
ncbi:SDR family NAD(P)-dependent oxidoreductase [Sutcliffiella sp. NC1]|uniref:SDR family NAD(P)-dependent oxidoreductase n=1 Tax=Sutcliffiella sp. NC1 TaxID=3004096 RepID=UPI0022DDB5D8|nr:SDR family oxidoreductase [Sutcliffiella sp. NC1]WBL15923.1 SDR family NAD(P)-dependent oxidoreductase [Sutcliffiella sp. NC1]